jgi:hypothetical protein
MLTALQDVFHTLFHPSPAPPPNPITASIIGLSAADGLGDPALAGIARHDVPRLRKHMRIPANSPARVPAFFVAKIKCPENFIYFIRARVTAGQFQSTNQAKLISEPAMWHRATSFGKQSPIVATGTYKEVSHVCV